MHGLIREANDAFYRAFESLDVERMKQVWSHSKKIQCVHPGQQPLYGFDSIMDSWQKIFAGTEYMEFKIKDEHILAGDGLAVVTNFEEITSAGQGVVHKSLVRATNVFVEESGSWLMVLHHAS